MSFQIREIDHVVIRAVDLPAMVRFYCDALGCRVERELRDIGLVQLRAGRSLIDLLAVKGATGDADRAGRNMDHLCLRIEPFDAAALRAHLARHGATLGEEALRYGADGYGPSLYLFDPEGNMIELKGPPQSGWRRRPRSAGPS
ncbi:MAG TPA: VOC family protein [Paraburkholderia sp.]|jgi:glyoxylase I family protein|nr:VOC family protein [Paraburkholderia sp.]